MENNKQNSLQNIFNLIGSSDKKSKQEAAEKMSAALNSEEKKELNSILNDKSKIEAILNSSAAQQILKKINGNNNGKHK